MKKEEKPVTVGVKQQETTPKPSSPVKPKDASAQKAQEKAESKSPVKPNVTSNEVQKPCNDAVIKMKKPEEVKKSPEKVEPKERRNGANVSKPGSPGSLTKASPTELSVKSVSSGVAGKTPGLDSKLVSLPEKPKQETAQTVLASTNQSPPGNGATRSQPAQKSEANKGPEIKKESSKEIVVEARASEKIGAPSTMKDEAKKTEALPGRKETIQPNVTVNKNEGSKVLEAVNNTNIKEDIAKSDIKKLEVKTDVRKEEVAKEEISNKVMKQDSNVIAPEKKLEAKEQDCKKEIAVNEKLNELIVKKEVENEKIKDTTKVPVDTQKRNEVINEAPKLERSVQDTNVKEETKAEGKKVGDSENTSADVNKKGKPGKLNNSRSKSEELLPIHEEEEEDKVKKKEECGEKKTETILSVAKHALKGDLPSDSPTAPPNTPMSSNEGKRRFRVEVWKKMEITSVLAFKRPCRYRIPHFQGDIIAAAKLSTLPVFQNAKVIKVNMDKAQESVRYQVIEARKELVTGCPGLREAVFLHVKPPIEPTMANVKMAASRAGICHLGTALEFTPSSQVDLVILGSVAVDKKGRRIGKGEGFSDLEYALLKKLGGIKIDAPVITVVHDLQVYDHLPDEIFSVWDVPVDFIVTPSQVIEVNPSLTKPSLGWNLLSNRRVNNIAIIKALLDKERSCGQEIRLKEEDTDDEDLVEIKQRKKYFSRRRFYQNRGQQQLQGWQERQPRQRMYSLSSQRGGQRERRAPRSSSAPPPHRGRTFRNRANTNGYQRNMFQQQQQQQHNFRPNFQQKNYYQRPQSNSYQQKNCQYQQNFQHHHNNNFQYNQNNCPHHQNTTHQRPFYNNKSNNGVFPIGQKSGFQQQDRNNYPLETNNNDPNMQCRISPKQGKKQQRRKEGGRTRFNIAFSVKLEGLRRGVRVRDLKQALQARGVRPRDISWLSRRGVAYLHFTANKVDCHSSDKVIASLKDLTLNTQSGTSPNIQVQPAPLPNKKVQFSD